jgi:hypothetical protein
LEFARHERNDELISELIHTRDARTNQLNSSTPCDFPAAANAARVMIAPHLFRRS